MTDEYDDIARRLREEGRAVAPPDLLPSVMAEVRAEPRTPVRRRLPALPRWQPLAAWTAGAAALVALGFGLAHLPSSGSNSSSAESLATPAAPAGVAGRADEQAHGSNTYTLPQSAARSILGRYYPAPKAAEGVYGTTTTYKVGVPGAVYSYYALRLLDAQRKARASTSLQAGPTVIIKLFRAHHSGTP